MKYEIIVTIDVSIHDGAPIEIVDLTEQQQQELHVQLIGEYAELQSTDIIDSMSRQQAIERLALKIHHARQNQLSAHARQILLCHDNN